MCGIFSYIGYDNINVKSAVDIINHRGPDSEGYFSYNIQEKTGLKGIVHFDKSIERLYFGFKRLAIIDNKSESDQPMSRDDLGLCIVFNGEIYNYVELKLELEEQGYNFFTGSDTEVILCAYDFWKEECLVKFNGMWSFAILDQKRNKLFCARDRFGVKPFYFYQDESQLILCSEIKQIFQLNIKKEINENVIRDYLELSLVDHTCETFYSDVYPLMGGHMFTVDLNEIRTIKPIEWYTLNVNKNINNFSENIRSFKNIFKRALEFRFRSDVPVGACLSGGLDSSSIVSYSASIFNGIDINVFNARFKDKKYDESYFADLVVDKYNNVLMNFCSLEPSQIPKSLEKVLHHQDEPFSDFGILSQWEVMRLANEKGVRVLLDGQGGDELLAGYRKYYAFYFKELLIKLRFFAFTKELFFLIKNKQFNFFDKEGIKRYLKLASSKKALSRKALNLKHEVDFGIRMSKSLLDCSIQDIKYFSFPPLLRYEDRNSMAFSIETRVPFMDYQLVEFSLGLPAESKIKNGYTKSILRDSMIGILPEEIRKRISKLGFSTPQADWLLNNIELREYFINYFKNMKNPYLNDQFILNDFMKYPNSKLTSTEFSKYLIFDFWYQMNFNKINK